MSAPAFARFTPSKPCPICGGHDQLPRGHTQRCYGYLDSTGKYARCTREEHAGGLPQNPDETYSHKLSGSCRCGIEHNPAPAPAPASSAARLGPIEAEYHYADEAGGYLFTVRRHRAPKTFRQGHYGGGPGAGSWAYGLGDTRRVLYRLPELRTECELGARIYVTEGEKDAEALVAAGACATCNPMGAGKWQDDYAESLSGASGVVIVADKDEAGYKHAEQVRASLEQHGLAVEVVEAAKGKDAADHLAAGLGVENFVPVERAESEAKTHGDSWDPIIPLERPPLPDFPLDALPGRLADYVVSVARSTETSPDLAAVNVLGVASAMLGGWMNVEVREGWQEPALLWLALVLESGGGKSPTLRTVAKPLREYQAELRERQRPKVLEAQSSRRMHEARLKRAEQDAVKSKQDHDRIAAEEEARELARTMPDEVFLPALTVQDATAEGIVREFVEQGGSIAVVSDEGGIIDTLAGRYSDGVANLDAVLKGYDGDPVEVSRRGSDRVSLSRVTIPILLSLQPTVLERVKGADHMEDRGLFPRFSFVRPQSYVGTRTGDSKPVPDELAEEWRQRVRSLALLRESATETTDSPRGTASVASVALSTKAEVVLQEVFLEIEPRLNRESGDLVAIDPWVQKTRGRIARTAAILHALEWGPAALDRPVSAETTESAAKVGAYLLEHAQGVFPLIGAGSRRGSVGSNDLRRARAILGWMRRSGVEYFTSRDVQQKNIGGRHEAGESDAALLLLEEHGYVKHVEPTPRHGPGRPPSQSWVVNPAVRATQTTKWVRR